MRAQGFTVWGKAFRRRWVALEMAWRFFESFWIMARVRPRRVVGFGGRDSLCLVALAAVLGCDTALYEPNVSCGKANALLVRWVRRVFTGFPQRVSRDRAEVVGIPLRESMVRIDRVTARKYAGIHDSCPVVVCCGGSQGSQFLNTQFVRFAAQSKLRFSIIHIAGAQDVERVRKMYISIHQRHYAVKDFDEHMERVYSAADLIVSRAGASSIAEIVSYGLPAVLVPHPAAGGHQEDNARYVAQRDAAVMVLQQGFNFDIFATALDRLITDGAYRAGMVQKCAQLSLGVRHEEFSKRIDRIYTI